MLCPRSRSSQYISNAVVLPRWLGNPTTT